LNIVLVNPEYPSPSGSGHGGIATYVYAMANALAGAANSAVVLAREGTVPDALAPGVSFHTFGHATAKRPFPPWDKLTKNDCAWEQGCSLAARETVLKLHGLTPIDCVEIPEYGGMAHQFTGALPFPVVVHFHTPTCLIDFYNNRRITRRDTRRYAFEAEAISRAVSYRCPSGALKTEVCRRFRIRESGVAVIPHPLDIAPFWPPPRAAAPKKTIDILFAGRLERRKGGEILARDAGRILSLDPRIRLTVAGETEMGEAGGFGDAVREAAAAANRDRIGFTGQIGRDELLRLYRSSDIFIMPSLFENAPYALLEAMAAGVPVIAARTGGIPELVSHGENGLLFDLDGSDGLVESIKKFIASPAMAAQCAERARRLVAGTCAPGRIAKLSTEFYAAAAAGRRS